MIELSNVSVAVGGAILVHDIDLSVAAGTWTAIVGPNGAGKSTLLRTIAGLTQPRGQLRLDSRDAAAIGPRERARLVAFVAQSPVVPPGMPVLDYALLGRTAYISPYGTETARDIDIARRALAQLGVSELAARAVDTLSGGERQRVLLARALAQEAPVLVLDELTAPLDIGAGHEVLELIDALRHERKLTVISALHDLTVAAQFAERIVFLSNGRVAADGPPQTVLTKERIDAAFGADVDVRVDAEGSLVISPRRARRRATS